MSGIQAWVGHVGTGRLEAKGDPRVVAPPAAESRRGAQGRPTPESCGSPWNGGGAQGGERSAVALVNQQGEEPVQTATPCRIAKRRGWEASKRVKANQGAAGVEEASLADVEGHLTPTLSQRWKRLASGSSLPSPGRTVMIPKRAGGQRA